MSYVIRRKVLWTLFLIGLALLAVVASRATTLARMSFDEMTRQATSIARAKCIGTSSVWRNGEIWTETDFELIEQNKGSLPEIFRVSMPGGRVAHLQSRVDGVPHFVEGEEVYLFLWNGMGKENYVLGWAQGAFRIVRDPQSGLDKVTQDSASLPVFDIAARKFRHGGVRSLPLPIFQLKLKRALEKQNR